MANEFLPKIKTFKEKYKEIKEQELTDDDIIALLDQHLQVEVTPEEEEPIEEEKDDHRSPNDEVPENDEIEQISESLNTKLEELDKYIADKKKEIDEKISKIKRKEPPTGDISDEAKTVEQKIKANWYEVDV